MIISLLVVLVVFDLFLLGLILSINNKQPDLVEVFKDINSEKKSLKNMVEGLKSDIDYNQDKQNECMKKMSSLANDVEMDIKNFKEIVSDDVKTVFNEFSNKFENHQAKIKEQKFSIESLIKKVNKQRLLLIKSVSRAEELTKFFSSEVPYEEVLTEIKDKKYQDARSLLTDGMPLKEVAKELGLSESEIRLMASLS